MRAAGGSLSVPELTHCHTVMGQSPDRRDDHLSGRRDRYGAAASVVDRRGEASNSTSHRRLHTRLCGRRAGLWASQSSQGIMWWWDSRPIHEPTTSAGAVVVKRSPTVAETALVYRVERSPRGCIGASGRVCTGGGREFGHPRARTVSCGGGTVARSMSRPPQPTPCS